MYLERRTRPFRRTPLALATGLVLCALFAACAPSTPPAAPTTAPAAPTTAPAAKPTSASPTQAAPAASGEPIKIGVVTSLTGPLALAGVKVKNGAELAADEINAAGGIAGRPVQLITEDAQSSNTTTVNAYNKMISEKPYAVIGPIYGTQNLALSPIVEREGIPHFYASGTVTVSKQGNKWLFGLTPSDEIAARVIARFTAKDLGKKRIAVEYLNNEYGVASSGIITSTLKDEFSLAPAGVESHGADDKDMSAQLLKLKDGNPDALIVWAFPADTAVIAKQAVELGLPRPFIGPTAPALPSTLALLQGDETDWYGEAPEFIEGNPDPKVTAFRDAYARKFNVPVDFFDAQHYDAMYMLKQAIEQALPASGGDLTKTREGIRDSLAKMKYQGLDASYEFDAEGRGTHGFTLVKVTNQGKSQEKVSFVRGD